MWIHVPLQGETDQERKLEKLWQSTERQTLIGAEHNKGGKTLGLSAEQVEALQIVKYIYF